MSSIKFGFWVTGRPAHQGVLGNFVPQFLRASPAGLGRPTAPTLVGDCYPPCLGGGAQAPHLPTFRAIAPCSGGHRVPLESSPFDGLIVSHFSGFVKHPGKIFLGSLPTIPRGSCLLQSGQRLAGLAELGSNARWKACTSPLGVPLLGSQRASLGGAGVRIPS